MNFLFMCIPTNPVTYKQYQKFSTFKKFNDPNLLA